MHQAPENLSALIRSVCSPLESLTPIATLRSRHPARVFRLVFADGNVRKGRQLESEVQAQDMQRLTALAGRDFSQVIARAGDTVLEEWVPGRVLSEAADTEPSLVARCGAMLGRLHALPAPADAPRRGVAWAVEQIEGRLRTAAELGALERDTVHDVRRAVRNFRPASASVGIVHVDFCGDNLVVCEPDRIVCVDNATVTFGPHDYDLARTWYRWPLNAACRRAFLAGYRAYRSPARFLEHFPFWALQALMVSVVYRARLGSASVAEPVARLKRLIEDPSPERAARDLFGPPDAPRVGAEDARGA